MKTIVITRPKEDAEKMAKHLQKCGFKTLVEPMLTIESIKAHDKALTQALQKKPGVILVTSRHALDCLVRLSASQKIPMLVVGKATALEAKKLGFIHVAVAGGTVGTLLTYAKQHYPAGARLLYLRGEDVSVDIAAELASRFTIDEIIPYRARAARSFSTSLRKALTQKNVDAVVFFSLRTAETYAALAKQYSLTKPHQQAQAITMSKAIAKGLGSMRWRSIHIALKPTLESVISSIKQHVC